MIESCSIDSFASPGSTFDEPSSMSVAARTLRIVTAPGGDVSAKSPTRESDTRRWPTSAPSMPPPENATRTPSAARSTIGKLASNETPPVELRAATELE